MEDLILKWQKRQQEYEELAERYKNNVHNNRKFTYKAMATRDCWKELYLQLLQPDFSRSYTEKQMDDAYNKGFKDAMVNIEKTNCY